MSSNMNIQRRTWLKGLGGSAVLALFSPLAAYSKTTLAASRLSPKEFKNEIRGPILSIPTCFTKNLDVDYQGFRQVIEQAQPAGIRIFALTAGNNQYAVLSRPEIAKITRVMIEAVGADGISIAATGDWELNETLEYAKLAENLGATALQVMKPANLDDDKVLSYFQRVANGSRLPLVLHGEFSELLLQRLVSLPSIVAMKEDVGPAYFINIQRKFGDRLAIFEGGPEYVYLIGYPYGAPASYSTLGTFAPQITARFWKALAKDDLREAYKIVMQYEHPFFDRWSHAFWRASLEHFGVSQRYLRPPLQALPEAEMQNVAAFYQMLGL